MLIQLDTEIMESLMYRLKRLNADAEETYAALHYTYGELSNQQELLMFPETHLALDSLGFAAGDLYRLGDEIGGMCTALSGAADEYKNGERVLEEKIAALAADLGVLSVNAGGVIAPDFAVTEISDEARQNAALAALVGQEADGLEMANLCALCAVIDKEYSEEER